METTEDPICCPKFDPTPWEDKNFEWNDKVFVKGSVFTIFYMPLNFGGTMMKMDKKIREAGADWSEGICLADHTSSWNMDLYVSVDKRVETLEKCAKKYGKNYVVMVAKIE